MSMTRQTSPRRMAFRLYPIIGAKWPLALFLGLAGCDDTEIRGKSQSDAGASDAGTGNAESGGAPASNAGATNTGIGEAGTSNASGGNTGATNAGATNAVTSSAGASTGGASSAGASTGGASSAGASHAGAPTCAVGTRGCACLSGNTCTIVNAGPPLKCVAGICSDCSTDDCGTTGLKAPTAPPCFTPCRSGFTDSANVYHACDSDGLMRHESGKPCLDGKVCTDGSCIVPGGALPKCERNLDCPDFQNCVVSEGKCYSVCDSDDDCPAASHCFKHACREACSSNDKSCGSQTECMITDGTNGYCMPVGANPLGPNEGPVQGTFAVSVESIAFNSNNINATFKITNSGPVAANFTVRKIQHTENGSSTPIISNPMHWVKMGEPGKESATTETKILVSPAALEDADAGTNATGVISLLGAANSALSRWEGVIEVKSEDARLGTRRINLSYVGSPNGRWAGKMYYFANFGTKKLDDWLADRTRFSTLSVVGNALVRRWGDFRFGQVSRANFEAALQSAVTGSWRSSSALGCAPPKACYLFADGAGASSSGVQEFSDALDVYPIPSGVSELPIAFDLATSDIDPTLFSGQIPTSEALHYPGNPKVSIKFATSPTASTCTKNAGDCVVFADSLSATIRVGGRYLLPKYGEKSGASDVCPIDWKYNATPWLVPGFAAWTDVNPENGLLYRSECRDKSQPGGLIESRVPQNVSLAGANPVPDGYTRSRTLSLTDGAMINQNSMILLVKESFNSMLGAASTQLPVAAYGVITLDRAPAQLDPKSIVGTDPPAAKTPPTEAPRIVTCSSSLLKKIGLSGDATKDIAPGNVASVVDAVLNGKPLTSTTATPLEPTQVHYLCHDTGRIDGGNTAANNGAPFECPAWSNVTYFYFIDTVKMPSAAAIAALPCQTDGSCQKTLDNWNSTHAWGFNVPTLPRPLGYRCQAANEVLCDADRGDLRKGKYFYADAPDAPVFTPLRTAINDAFRYKTQFRTRTGKNVGFAPQACVPNSDAVPYCYDASQIEEARDRVDCALSIYHTFRTSLDSATQSALVDYLKINFAYSQTIKPPLYVYDGFEMMYAELLVTLGDDAYTSSFTARFDLASANHATFQGSLFESGGIDLSGAAGFEMYELYQATQYYGQVLDRLYVLAPYLVDSTGAFNAFVTPPTFTSYFPKLVRASAQRTRAWSEIAKRYQAFNRPALARSVVERAYTSAYLESVIIGNLVTRYLPSVTNEKDQIEKDLYEAALTYGAALLDMRDIYRNIVDGVTFFGFAPDYIPFPALDATDANAFSKVFAFAQQRMTDAGLKEQNALGSSRTYETDAASFQSELVKLRINYDNQLGDICGTFTGEDGAVYPAIPKYAYQSASMRVLGDPCGLVGNGKLYDSMGQLEVAYVDLKRVERAWTDVFAEIDIENDRIGKQCGLVYKMAAATLKTASGERKAQAIIDAAEVGLTQVKWLSTKMDVLNIALTCEPPGPGGPGNCAGAWGAYAKSLAAAAVFDATETGLQLTIDDQVRKIADLKTASVVDEINTKCDLAKVDSDAVISNKMLQLESIRLDALKAQYNTKLAFSQVEQYRNKAKSLANEASEMEEQTINIEAARNDPNVRIYKNDAIINADRAFDSAIAAAYQATKVYEYYSSQSYAHLGDLFLVRMVNYGDYNLNNYLTQLQDSFLSFQQDFGNPDNRVEIISLRDDVFDIPRLDNAGLPVTQAARIQQFQQKLKDVSLLDEQGYLTVPFATTISRLSPVTRNHKVRRLEAEIIGSDIGDTVGRIYVRQKGTGVVKAVTGKSIYYRFPPLTAVLDPFFNGVRVFTPEVYSNDRMRDRPVSNSRWDLVINQKDEAANMDINLNSVTDVRLYLYYTDFTAQ